MEHERPHLAPGQRNSIGLGWRFFGGQCMVLGAVCRVVGFGGFGGLSAVNPKQDYVK